jgi:hypothetical protein
MLRVYQTRCERPLPVKAEVIMYSTEAEQVVRQAQLFYCIMS